ncbi:histone-lysine N-methyltransferase family member SUVH9-like [Tripterygium wilfordii]|uniref:Histone-lysine N-methyltransferase family member SUVH9-like n=1 Tax=Tripterygium wilfordii TaxID=458696 RepID=A0A7J7CRL4_TRIWF|nr:histone-lysine N-methyltransferase family member SUVH9-like [Tripterygium wilfordii]XP_038723505.1 histone-lysine N-methyltransferase family member SUVH9-like [Tripterygium wilfordii]KAF5736701.1 histone-lysine N-methyltransferase family member SUVH9-like [Tripterygium wilfordii]
MGSLVDLNLCPDSSTPSTSAAATTTTDTVLRIPKLEPIDPSFQTYPPQQQLQLRELTQPTRDALFSDSTPVCSLDLQNAPPSQIPDQGSLDSEFHRIAEPTQNALFSDSTPVCSLDLQNAPPSQNPDQDSLDSEFHRVAELFRAAFAKRLQKYGDVEVVDPDSRAIVPVSSGQNAIAVPRSARKRAYPRSGELVRVADMSIKDQLLFRDGVRRTRMIYDVLRIQSVVEEDRRRGEDLGRRPRGDLRAASLMRDRGLWLNRDKRIVGSIPGVQVGDIFFFRMELCVVGLHGQLQAGIDYVPISQSSNGEPIATSVIVSGGYEDDEDAGDVIVYTGHGGRDSFSKQCEHQKLEGGNLAMERSMHYGIEVRVIRGFRYEGSIGNKVYVYDGLYKILDCWFDVGKSGFGVYKYKLLRIEGQPEMGSAILRFAQNLRTNLVATRPSGYLSLDISNRKENVAVLLFNDIDNDHEPLYYEYLVRTVFPPYAFNQTSNGPNGTGCDCVSGCTESSDSCACAMKNGGEFAYDQNGILLKGKSVIFECGPCCACPPSCRNRVTQKGLRNRLEVFRSRETGWGVRSLDLIQAGAFICEYTGVVLTREQAHIFTMNGDSLIYPNRFSERWVEWGDLSLIFSAYARPSYPSIPPLDFAMDVSRMRNVACYMSHSSSPNVLVQCVLYDHNNVMFPHLMLFAMENIPPLRELSLDYGVADEWTGKLAICN